MTCGQGSTQGSLQIENAMYPVNVEALNTVFSPYGFVQKIAIFEKNGQTQVGHALTRAKQALHGELSAIQGLLAICKAWGYQTLELFEALQALIQYPDPTSAGSAKQALEGHAIYEGGCNKVSLGTAVYISSFCSPCALKEKCMLSLPLCSSAICDALPGNCS